MGFLGGLFFFGHDQEAYQPQKSLLLGAEVGDIEPQEIFILRVLHAVKVDTQIARYALVKNLLPKLEVLRGVVHRGLPIHCRIENCWQQMPHQD